MSRVRNFCFTFNNYTFDSEELLKQWLIANTKYAIFGHEIAPTTGTPHLQGYMNVIKQMTIKALQKKLPIKMAVIISNGTAKQNFDYCTKSDPSNYWEYGDIDTVGQGRRNDLKEPAEKLLNKRPLIEVALEHPEVYIKYHRGLEKLVKLISPPPPEDRDITVSVFWGPGGTGKTRAAVEWARRLNYDYFFAINPQAGNQWWDTYQYQQLLIIDDFYGWINPHYLFRILDRYPVLLPIKGDHVHARWTHVIVTSNVEPARFYRDEVFLKLDATAYFRRFHNVYRYDFDGVVSIEKEEKPFTCINI